MLNGPIQFSKCSDTNATAYSFNQSVIRQSAMGAKWLWWIFHQMLSVNNNFNVSFNSCNWSEGFLFYWLSELSSISYPELQPNRGWSSCDCSHQSRCEKPSWPFSRFSNKKSYWFFFFTFNWIDWNIHSRSSLIKFSSIHLQDLITFDAWKKTFVNCQLLHFKF